MNSNVVYQITSPSGNRYIGSARDFHKRKTLHLHHLRGGKHHSRSLQRAWLKYDGHLEFSVILTCREKDLFFYEQILIDGLKPDYNVSPTACGTRGLKWSDESIERVRAIRKIAGSKLSVAERERLAQQARLHLHSREGKEKSAASHRTPEYKAAAAARLLGKRQSPELIAKRALAIKGRLVSEETRAKLAAQAGWKHTDEARAKMLGRVVSEQTRQLQGARARGKQHRLGAIIPDEMRQRISMALKGRKRSPEAIAKHRATMAGRRALLNEVTT